MELDFTEDEILPLVGLAEIDKRCLDIGLLCNGGNDEICLTNTVEQRNALGLCLMVLESNRAVLTAPIAQIQLDEVIRIVKKALKI